MSVVESCPNRAVLSQQNNVPDTMLAAVYRGNRQIVVESVPTPGVGPGEILVRVESCGVCHTDLKKIEYDLLPAPRIFGHETAGVVAAIGENVTRFAPGDRVVAFHHVPCRSCFYCARRLYAQCPVYKKVGITAAFEPAGGGFAQYVRVMDWIVDSGVERIPDGVSFDQACWVEPVNTCVKGVEMLNLRPTDVVAVLGQGPIGLIFTMLVRHKGAAAITSDTIGYRRELSALYGAYAFDPRGPEFERAIRERTAERGADCVIVATNAPGLVDQALSLSRPGAKILLFAQTSSKERIEISGADVCVGERILLGSYSADIDLQKESARLVFSGELPLEDLISHRVSLSNIVNGIETALHPTERSLKVVVHPQEQPAVSAATMQAAVLYGKEDVRLENVPVPEIGPGEILVRVRTALTCGTDVKVFRRGYHAKMIQPPALFGHEMAGDIVAVGAAVKGFRVGQRIVAANSAPCDECFFCQRGQHNLCEDLLFNNGAYAEFIRIPARIVAKNTYLLADDLAYKDAALVEPLACALRGLQESGVRPGDTVAVMGLGPIGLMFVRLARYAVGARVIAMARRLEQVDRAIGLGAHEGIVMGADRNAIAEEVRARTSGRGADVVFEAIGQAEAWETATHIVRKGGSINFFGGCPSGTRVALDTGLLHYSEITCRASFHHTPGHIREALKLIGEGVITAGHLVNHEEPLTQLPQVLADMAHRRNGQIKTAIIP